jgi:anti-sigma factor RsiW
MINKKGVGSLFPERPEGCCGQGPRNPFGDLLVDYVDGELPDGDARRVEEHLQACAACRAEVRRLEVSLAAARDVWRESAASAPGAELPAAQRRRSPVRAAACVAVCGLLAAALVAWWVVSREGPAPQIAGPGEARPSAPVQEVPDDPVPDLRTPIDVEEYLAREARAARLAASLEVLASQPELEEYRRRAERYLLETYGDTDVVRSMTRETEGQEKREHKS